MYQLLYEVGFLTSDVGGDEQDGASSFVVKCTNSQLLFVFNII